MRDASPMAALYGAAAAYNAGVPAMLEARTTFATAEDALSAARTLVSERLAACAQIVPQLTSVYMWEGMLRHEQEVLLVLKTTESAWPALRDRLAELHPYDTPEIIATRIDQGSYDYMAWVAENTR
jgi:periplasmic divalent cation tolerance protein